MKQKSAGFLQFCLIASVFLGAFALRVWGINFQVDTFFHQDEAYIVEIARGMIKTWDFNPHFFQVPSFYIYLQALAYNLIFVFGFIFGTFFSLDSLPDAFFIYGGRLLSAFLGSLNVIVVYSLGKRLFSRTTGYLAAAFLAVLLVHVQHSQIISTDTPLALFISLAMLFICIPLLQGNISKTNRRAYLMAGLFIGLAAGTRYIGALMLIPLITSQFLKSSRKFGFGFWVSLVTAVIIFFATSPFLILDANAAWTGFMNEFRLFQLPQGFGNQFTTAFEAINYLFRDGLGFIVLTLAAIGIVSSLKTKKFRNQTIVILAFILPYIVVISIFFQIIERILMPILPFLAIYAAMPIMEVVRYILKNRKQQRFERKILVLITVVLIAYPLFQSIRHGFELSRLEDFNITDIQEDGTATEMSEQNEENQPQEEPEQSQEQEEQPAESTEPVETDQPQELQE
jgi:4-amino-4-deoxy-L-arabinose transferase-like glycosyltransferase